METTGDRIRARRKELGLTMRQLHERVGLSTGNLSDLENGKYAPSLSTLALLSEILACSIDWLVTGVQPITQMLEHGDAYVLSGVEVELVDIFRNLDDRDQAEVVGIAKMKANRVRMGNTPASSTSASGDANTTDKMVG